MSTPPRPSHSPRPNANRVIGTTVGKERWKYRCAKGFESILITEELRHANQKFTEEQIGLMRIRLELRDVRCNVIQFERLHPALHGRINVFSL